MGLSADNFHLIFFNILVLGGGDDFIFSPEVCFYIHAYIVKKELGYEKETKAASAIFLCEKSQQIHLSSAPRTNIGHAE